MKILEVRDLPLAGAKLVVFGRFHDERGYFAETYRKSDFVSLAGALGLASLAIEQANESRSLAGVIRGLHFQYDPPMGKLIRLVYGHGVDMALDVRSKSPTFGRLIMVEMSFEPFSGAAQWIWLPPGLAHGNFYLADSAIEYFCTAPYNPAGEVGINPLDPGLDLGLCPPSLACSFRDLLARGPILSLKDTQGMDFADWRADARANLL